jgi:hypothetical protein
MVRYLTHSGPFFAKLAEFSNASILPTPSRSLTFGQVSLPSPFEMRLLQVMSTA